VHSARGSPSCSSTNLLDAAARCSAPTLHALGALIIVLDETSEPQILLASFAVFLDQRLLSVLQQGPHFAPRLCSKGLFDTLRRLLRRTRAVCAAAAARSARERRRETWRER
jgi:hypothetical protein